MMNVMQPTSSLAERVAAASGELTPTDRRIAEAVLAEPTLLAFGTVSDLAGRVDTSRPSIVRFANKLGFAGYSELQRLVRSDVSRQLSRPVERIRRDSRTVPPLRETIVAAIDSVFQAVSGRNIASLTRPIVRAKRVWILSGETSGAGAHAFYSGLSMIRGGVHLLENCSFGTELAHAARGDVAVVFDFYRYRKQIVRATELLAESGVEIVAITDGPLSPLVELSDVWCEISIPAIGPFDSSVPTVAIAELLVARVAQQLHDQAAERIDRIEELWESTEVYF